MMSRDHTDQHANTALSDLDIELAKGRFMVDQEAGGGTRDDAITTFQGDDYGFLSNLTRADVTFEDEKYPSLEHAFQAAKTQDPALRARIWAIRRPSAAREVGNTKWVRLATRPDWDDVKQGVMLQLVRQKFTQPKFRKRLLATGDRELVETNEREDRFWGVDRVTGEGNNRLGKILMQVRAELRAAEAERRERPYLHDSEGPENARY